MHEISGHFYQTEGNFTSLGQTRIVKKGRIRIYHIYSKKCPGPGALQFRSLKMTLRQNVGKYTKNSIMKPFCMLFSNFGQGKDFRLINKSKIV